MLNELQVRLDVIQLQQAQILVALDSIARALQTSARTYIRLHETLQEFVRDRDDWWRQGDGDAVGRW